MLAGRTQETVEGDWQAKWAAAPAVAEAKAWIWEEFGEGLEILIGPKKILAKCQEAEVR